MDRRGFFKVGLNSAVLVAFSPYLIEGYLRAEDGSLFKAYNRVKLLDSSGAPLKESTLKEEIPYVFNYPYASTPNFIIKLKENSAKNVKLVAEDGTKYIWKGGVGKDGKIVSYSAICPHQLTHPTPNDSFITYVPKSKKTMAYKKGEVIVCSSHLSVYDPKSGAKVLAGPAPQPLASIVLDVDKEGVIWAEGVLGADKFYDYFRSFKPEIKEFFGNIRKGKKLVKVGATVLPLSEYSKDIIQY